ncbi:MAG TPA: baseplate J/gp47 family protein [Polyangiaceae bacterium]|nr:baseplate J/gp47 family protein [Polyangiaceae bacterium]
MPTFGLTPEGFVAPSVRDLLDLIEADQLAGISPALDVSAESPIGQNNGIFANYLAQGWEALAACYSGFDPDKAEDTLLTMLAKLTGTPRAAATKSTVLVTVTASLGTVLLAGTHFASVSGKPDVKFTPAENFTATIDGANPNVLFEAESTGPIQAPHDQLTIIATPVVGWAAVNNPGDAHPGANVASDAQLRLTRQRELTRAGSSTIDAIRAKLVVLLEDIPGASVASFNNVTDAIDGNGLPPHSFEMVVWDPSGAITNDQIAQTIWDSKPAGIRAYGSVSGNAVDKAGAIQLVNFSRATVVPIWITMTVAARPGYVGDSLFAQTVARYLSDGVVVTDDQGNRDVILEPYATGTDVTAYDITLATQGLGAKVTVLTFGTSASPVSSSDVAIGIRQIATFDSVRIVVNH